MPRPLIGLTVDSGEKSSRYELHMDYVSSVEKAGGAPLAIPFSADHSSIPRIVESLDGILFTGGDDLDPSLYGEQWHDRAIRIDPVRQAFELALLAEIEKRRRPVLGICLGCQVMNVYRGGSLHQFLPDLPRPNPIEHRKLDRPFPSHPVQLEMDSVLGRAIGESRIVANTYHKQSAKHIGRGLRVVGTAPDGIVEAFEDPDAILFAAVQWHPERLQDEKEHLALFKLLVERASQRR